MISKNTYLKIKNFKWEKLLFKKNQRTSNILGEVISLHMMN